MPTSIKALDNNHEIVPVLNKIDLPAAEPERIKQQIEDVIGLDAHDAVEISAKTGLNVDDGAGSDRAPAAPAKGRREGSAESHADRQLV